MFKEKYNAGKLLREKTPRSSHAALNIAADRPSVESMIEASNFDRLPDLVPIRHFRMTKSPFVFYRATASLMARDLSATPSSGIIVQACGDCHLMNFGGFATPERTMILDMNDFDETHPAPWEWDLKRLATSFFLAGREKAFTESDSMDITRSLVLSYQEKMNEYAKMNFLDLWYMKFSLEELERNAKTAEGRERVAKALKKAEQQTHDRVFYKITASILGKIEISDQPPLIYHPFDLEESKKELRSFVEFYKTTLQKDRKLLLDNYKLVDVALKVVGVGSVGTRCYVVLLMNDNDEPLFLQVKEARPSVLQPYTLQSEFQHMGERVVQGQRLIQSASDIFLGWATGPTGKHFYLRQLRDKKLSPQIEQFNKSLLASYAEICGNVLARAHCKTYQGPLICGYMGKGETFANAICTFASLYAGQTENDYNDFLAAVKNGKLPVKEEPMKSN